MSHVCAIWTLQSLRGTCYPPLALAPQQTPPAIGPTVFADVARNQRSEEFCACRGNIDFSSYFGRFGISNMDCAASKSPRDLYRPPFAAVVRRRRSKPPTSPPLPDSGAVPSFQFLVSTSLFNCFFFSAVWPQRESTFFLFFVLKIVLMWLVHLFLIFGRWSVHMWWIFLPDVAEWCA